MLEKKTIVDRIEVDRNGLVGVRLGLLILDNGVEIGCSWHRTVIEPGTDAAAQMAAVNSDITTRPELRARPVGDISRLQAICEVVHTDDVVEAHRARITGERPKPQR